MGQKYQNTKKWGRNINNTRIEVKSLGQGEGGSKYRASLKGGGGG